MCVSGHLGLIFRRVDDHGNTHRTYVRSPVSPYRNLFVSAKERLHLFQVAGKSIRESLRLPVLARNRELKPTVPDDVSNPVPVGNDWPEPEKPEARVPTVTSAQDRVVQGLPPSVVEEARGLR